MSSATVIGQSALDTSIEIVAHEACNAKGGCVILQAGMNAFGEKIPASLRLTPDGEIYFNDRKLESDADIIQSLRTFVLSYLPGSIVIMGQLPPAQGRGLVTKP